MRTPLRHRLACWLMGHVLPDIGFSCARCWAPLDPLPLMLGRSGVVLSSRFNDEG